MRGLPPFNRRSRRFGTTRATRLCIVVVVLFALASPMAATSGQVVTAPNYGTAHPIADGAPFFADQDRTAAVIERSELLRALEQLDIAEPVLKGRANASGTAEILAAQRTTYERALADLQPALDELAGQTAAFGIDAAVFPVDQLRKPFRDDWGDPRSGGRRHQGTDMLAQIGVPLRAIEDSTFERTTNGGLGGLSVYLRGDSGARYFYAHLDSAIEFDEGQRIYAGEIIGTNGDTGNARGAPHLHLQIAPDGETGWENPYPLLDVLFGPRPWDSTEVN